MTTTVKISQVIPGMVLAVNAISSNGRVLLPAGNVISEKHLKIFKSWGVVELEIQASPEIQKAVKPNSGSPSSATKLNIDPEIKERFRFTNKKHPAIQEMMGIVLMRQKEGPS